MPNRMIFQNEKTGEERETPYPDTLELHVLEHHIKNGHRGSAVEDPFSLAAMDLFPNQIRVDIFENCLHLLADWRMTIWQALGPDQAKWTDWLFRYHTGQLVEPVSLTILRIYDEEKIAFKTNILRRWGSSQSDSRLVALRPLPLRSSLQSGA